MFQHIQLSALGHGLNICALSIQLTKAPVNNPVYTYVTGPRNYPTWIRKLGYGLNLLKAVNKEIKRGVKVVHLLWVGFPVITPYIIKHLKRSGVRVLVTVLNRHSPPSRYWGADLIFVHSKETLANYLNAGYPEDSLNVIKPPVDLSEFKPLNSPPEPFFVMASGPRTIEQIEERGLILLFQAFEILAERRSPAKLHFFGRWQEGAPVIEKIKARYTLPNVILHHEYEPELPTWVARSSGVIIPYVSKRIGDVPMSALESMACGRPAIATSGIGLDEFLTENGSGILIQPDAISLANAVEKVMQNPDAWRSGALNTVKELDAKVFGERMCRHYQMLL